MKINNTEVIVENSDLLSQSVDCIVVSFDSEEKDHIYEQAGQDMVKELIRKTQYGVQNGEAIITYAHKLKQKYIVHTVGPIWNGGNHEESLHLAQSYVNSIKLADKAAIKIVAFSSISTSDYSYPLDEAADLAIHSVLAYLEDNPRTKLRKIIFALPKENEYKYFNDILLQLEVEENIANSLE